MDTTVMYNNLVKDGLDLVDITDIRDQYSNMDIEFGSTILQKENLKKQLENSHRSINNEINLIEQNNKELRNSIDAYKRDIESVL